jgi:hypothetical protein
MLETNTAYIYFCEKMRPIIIEKIDHNATDKEVEQYLEHMWKESNGTKDMSYDISNTLFERAHTQSGVVIAGIVHLPNQKVVEIYGEIAGEENLFCETLVTQQLLAPYRVLCEYATVLCETTEKDYELVVTGTEYIFFNLMQEGVTIPICFDNRIESGFPTSIEERYYLSFFEPDEVMTFTENKLAELYFILNQLYQVIVLLTNESVLFEKVFEEEYIQMMIVIATQFEILFKSAEKGNDFLNASDTFIEGIINSQIILDIGHNLASNIIKCCSAFVDIKILSLVKRETHDKIVIFCGASHAYRLLTNINIFKNWATMLVEPTKELVPLLVLEPKGSYEEEKELLRILESV